ncbi:hypothetical protein D3C73_1604720 [compost metagenome]
MMTATASENPTSLITSSSPATNPANTATMIAAADVMTRPERCSPSRTESSLLAPASCSSLIRDSRNTS